MSTLAVVGAFTAFGLLLFSGLAHLRQPVAFWRALRRQAVFPDRLAWLVAFAVIAAEVLVGGVGCFALAVEVFTYSHAWAAAIAYPVTVVATVMYTCFAVYSAYLVLRRPQAPCGCSMVDHPVDWIVVGRATVLALACGTIALMPGGGITTSLVSTAGLIVFLSAVAFVVLAWSLPAALRNPD